MVHHGIWYFSSLKTGNPLDTHAELMVFRQTKKQRKETKEQNFHSIVEQWKRMFLSRIADLPVQIMWCERWLRKRTQINEHEQENIIAICWRVKWKATQSLGWGSWFCIHSSGDVMSVLLTLSSAYFCVHCFHIKIQFPIEIASNMHCICSFANWNSVFNVKCTICSAYHHSFYYDVFVLVNCNKNAARMDDAVTIVIFKHFVQFV